MRAKAPATRAPMHSASMPLAPAMLDDDSSSDELVVLAASVANTAAATTRTPTSRMGCKETSQDGCGAASSASPQCFILWPFLHTLRNWLRVRRRSMQAAVCWRGDALGQEQEQAVAGTSPRRWSPVATAVAAPAGGLQTRWRRAPAPLWRGALRGTRRTAHRASCQSFLHSTEYPSDAHEAADTAPIRGCMRAFAGRLGRTEGATPTSTKACGWRWPR